MKRWGILLVAASGLWLAACKKEAPISAAPVGAMPTQVLQHFQLNDVQNGFKTMMLEATEGRVYEKEQYADLDQPFVTFYKAGQLSSKMWAPAGKVYLKTHEIEAWNGVTVVSADSATLTTERLRYDPQLKKIISNDAVRLQKPDSLTDGQGLEADPDLKVVKIGRQKVTIKKGGAL